MNWMTNIRYQLDGRNHSADSSNRTTGKEELSKSILHSSKNSPYLIRIQLNRLFQLAETPARSRI